MSSPSLRESIEFVPEFLAHALELEVESVQRYQELADSMETHHNDEVAALFRQLAAFSQEHAEEVQERVGDRQLPEIPPWDFKWNCPGSPESGDCTDGDISYLMNTRQALDLALHNEARGRDFYTHVAKTTGNPDVSALAAEMAEEEAEHVDMLRMWMIQAGHLPQQPQEDMDPPNMPE